MKMYIFFLFIVYSLKIYSQDNVLYNTWDTLYTIPNYNFNRNIKDLKINNNNMTIVGYDGLIANSNDYGKTWNEMYVGTNAELNKIFYTNNTNFWISGNKGTLIKYNLETKKYQDYSINSDFQINSIYFSDENNGLLASTYGFMNHKDGYLLKTTDGGIKWDTVLKKINFEPKEDTYNNVKINVTNFSFSNIIMKNNLEGYVLGCSYTLDKSFIYETKDGGNKWKLIITLPDELVYGMSIIDNEIWLVGKDGLMCKSSDEGKSWKWYNKNKNETIFKIKKQDNIYIISTCLDKDYNVYTTKDISKAWHLEITSKRNFNSFNPIIIENRLYLSSENSIINKKINEMNYMK